LWQAATKSSGFGSLDAIGSPVEPATKSSGFGSPVAPGSAVELKNPESFVTVV